MNARLCGALALLVYLLLPNRDYSFDAMSYAYAGKSGAELFHPHHLLYNPLGHALYRLCGGRVESLVLMRLVNSAAVAGLVALVAAAAARLGARPRVAAACALLCGCSYGVWYAGTSVEAYPVMLLLVMAAVSVAAWGGARGAWLGAGLLTGLAGAFHQTGVLVAPIVCLVLLRRQVPVRWVAAYLLSAAGVAALPYALVAWHLQLHAPRDVLRWVLFYTTLPQYHTGAWGGGLALAKLPLAAMGLGSALFYPRFIDEISGPGAPALGAAQLGGALLIVLFAATLVTLLVRAARRPRGGASAGGPLPPRLLALWVLILGGFTLWWDPGNQEFWVAIVPPLCLLLAGALGRLPAGAPGPLLLVGLACAGNLITRVYPDSRRENNVALQIMDALGALGPQDLVISNVNHLIPYSKYAWGWELQVASLLSTPYDAAQGPAAKEAARRAYVERIERARGGPGRVLLLEMEVTPTFAQLYATTLWDREDLRQVYQPYLGAPVVGQLRAYNRAWKIYGLR